MSRLTQQQKKIIKQIRTLHAVEKQPLNISYVKLHHPKLLRQVMSLKHFRGWRNALEAAGLSYDVIRVELADHLHCAICGKKLKTLTAHLPSAHQMNTEEYAEQYPGEPTTSDAMRAKTTWSLRKKPHWERIWSREYLIDYMIYKYERDEDLSPWTVYRKEPWVHANAKAYFGTYRAAIEAAGIDYREVRVIDLTEKWTEEKVIDRLRRLHLEEPLASTNDIRLRDSRLYDSCHRYFGGPVLAIEAAGIPYTALRGRRSKSWDRPDVLRTIQVLAAAGLSIRPNALDAHMDDSAPQLLEAAARHFGSWEQAVKKAGVDYANHRGSRSLQVSANGVNGHPHATAAIKPKRP
ncbi:MAG: MucR family transcriptional regulator [Pirellulales bacterium]